MIAEFHIPTYPLNNYIDHFFYYAHHSPAHNIERFLPDGNSEIVIDLTNDQKFIYDNNTLEEEQACNQMWVSGVRTQPITIPSGREDRMIIVSFKKGRTFPFYSFPVSELVDHVVDADLIFGDRTRTLRNRLLESKSSQEMFQILEVFLLDLAKRNFEQNLGHKCINYAVSAMLEKPADITLKTLSTKIGFSQKHFIQLFRNQVGLSPKKYLSILRFQQAINEIELKPKAQWSELALLSGYFDQSHLINEFKKYSGFTPQEYLERKTVYTNNIPVA